MTNVNYGRFCVVIVLDLSLVIWPLLTLLATFVDYSEYDHTRDRGFRLLDWDWCLREPVQGYGLYNFKTLPLCVAI